MKLTLGKLIIKESIEHYVLMPIEKYAKENKI